MAKKKKKSTTRRKSNGRRRVGAIKFQPSGDVIQLAGGVILSNVAGRFITQFAKKTFPSVKPAILDWAMVALQGGGGILLASNTKNSFLKGAGIGFAAAGAGQALTNVGVKLSGTPVMIPMRGNMVGYATPNGDFPQPARVGNATNSFVTPSRVGRMNNNKVAYAAGAM